MESKPALEGCYSVFIGQTFLFSLRATSPYCKMELYEDYILLKAWSKEVKLKYSEIDYVLEFMAPLASLKINHHSSVSPYLVFMPKKKGEVINFLKHKEVLVRRFGELSFPLMEAIRPMFEIVILLSLILVSISFAMLAFYPDFFPQSLIFIVIAICFFLLMLVLGPLVSYTIIRKFFPPK